MWLQIFKFVLLAFIAIGVTVIVITYIRKSRTVRFRPRSDPNLGSLSTVGVPPTPLPEWVHWTDDNDEDDSKLP